MQSPHWCAGVLRFSFVLVLLEPEGVASLWSPLGGLLLDTGHVSKIPMQLILTGKWPSLSEAPRDVLRNMNHTLSLNPELSVRWFGDATCREYIQQHFDAELLQMFVTEKRGSFRGDLCRTAVLTREGGFYTDLDIEWKVPLRSIVSESTTFMSSFGNDGEVLNAMLAAEKGSAVMSAALEELRKWYRSGPRQHHGWMGPVTLSQALQAVQRSSCPDNKILQQRQGLDSPFHKSMVLEWSCGQHTFRLYQQRILHCKQRSRLMRSTSLQYSSQDEECPPIRARSLFDGVRFGLFEPGPSGRLIAWPRFASCGQWGCGGGGWTESKIDAK